MDTLRLNQSYWNPKVPLLYSIETSFNIDESIQFMSQYWTYSIPVSIVYFISSYVFAHRMSNRSAYHLRRPLTVWSTLLAIFSLFGALNTVPEAIFMYNRNGWFALICDHSSSHQNPQLYFWIYAFAWSKLIEFGDTVFIVARKQKLTFLHTIHHALTFVFTFYAYRDASSILRLPSAMNYSIHTLMYTYFALRAVGVRLPRWLQMTITLAQIVQMVVGAIGIERSLWWHLVESGDLSKPKCSISLSAAISGVCLYLLYFGLFINFFYQAYVRKPSNQSKLDSNESFKRK